MNGNENRAYKLAWAGALAIHFLLFVVVFPETSNSLDVGPDEPDELDLSDMEKFFEEEKTPEDEDITDEAIEDLDLDFDLNLEPETDTSTEDIETEEKPDELDLSDIEEILDLEELETEEKQVPNDIVYSSK